MLKSSEMAQRQTSGCRREKAEVLGNLTKKISPLNIQNTVVFDTICILSPEQEKKNRITIYSFKCNQVESQVKLSLVTKAKLRMYP